MLVDYSIDKPPASDTPYTILVLSELLDMSQKAEQTSAAGDSWKQVDKGTASQQDIEAIYKSIWSDRKPAAGANLTDMERMQYGRQNSAGLGAQGDGQHKEAKSNSGRAGYDLPNVTINTCKNNERESTRVVPNFRDQASEFSDRAYHHAANSMTNCRSNHEQYQRRPNGYSENNQQPYKMFEAPNYYENPTFKLHEGKERFTTYQPIESLTDRHDELRIQADRSGEARWHRPGKESIEERTQKVCYPDGSSRVVLRDQNGKISAVVNPDGSRLERLPAKPGEAPSWRAFSLQGTPIIADNFRGSVEMSEDGTFKMTKTYPVPQQYEQKPDGSYRKAYKGGAAEQWTAMTQTKTVLYPNGKVRELKFSPDEKGILEQTAVTDR